MVRSMVLIASSIADWNRDTGWTAASSRLNKACRQHVLATEGDGAALGETASGKGIQSQEVGGESAGIDDFDEAVP
jgi:hypothetical protein